MIDITDILDRFKFGNSNIRDQWIVEANSLEDSWKPIFHLLNGLCYMFESRNFPVLSPNGEQFLRMILHFDVS